MWRILYPIQYFRLSNKDKQRIDVWPTLALAVLLAGPFVFLSGPSFFHVDGFLDKVLSLTSGLTGFYVAALVAAATFTHPDLDKVIKSGPISLITKDANGDVINEPLTRREFACTIFGYLSFSTLTLSLACAFAVALSKFDWMTLGSAFLVCRSLAIFVFALWISHVTTVTALGLFYLMDRLYRHDPDIVTTKDKADDMFQ